MAVRFSLGRGGTGAEHETQHQTQPEQFATSFICLSTFDAATKSIGSRLGNRLSGEGRIERIAQFAGSHLGLVARVIDSSSIKQLVVAVEKVGLRCNSGAQAVSDLVPGVFQNRERQFLFDSVRFNRVCGFGDVELIPITLIPFAL